MNMKKSMIISYSTIALVSLLVFGCSTADRTSDKQAKDGGVIDNPATHQPGDNNNSIQGPPNTGGSVGQDDNGTSVIKIDAKNAYKVSVGFDTKYEEKGYYSKEEVGRLSFNITNLYTGLAADTSIIDEIVIEAEEKIVENGNTTGKYLDFIKYTGEQGYKYIIPKEAIRASDNVALKVKNLSGTTNIIFKAIIKLNNSQDPLEYTIKVPIVIEKNRSSSMSITRFNSKYDTENGLFIDKFVIHVVDRYGNKAQDGTKISTGVINNTKLYSKAYNDTTGFYNDDRGNLNRSTGSFRLQPNSIDDGLNDNINTDDTLIVLANSGEHKPENLGGWDIESVDISNNELKLVSLDSGTDVLDVSYAIGNEYRYDRCDQTIINAAASTFESTDVKDGLAFAELRYPPEMVGKNIFIYANTRLDDKHIGISRNILLFGTGLQDQTLSCTNEKGAKPNCSARFRIEQNDSGREAREVNIATPQFVGEPSIYNYATATQTDCSGWTTISIFGIDENKTATVKFGRLIRPETIKNQK